MPLLTPLMTVRPARATNVVLRRVETIAIHIGATLQAAAKRRRERTMLRELDAMPDDRLYDLGLSREAVRWGLSARSNPLGSAFACRAAATRRVGPGADIALRFPRERYLGW